MKALYIHNDKIILTGGLSLPPVTLYADSAIGRDVMPLFLPDLPVDFHARMCVAARIAWLGKCVREKFAARYVDAISVVCVMVPDDSSPGVAELKRSGYMEVMDGAVTTGRWLDPPLKTADSLIIRVGEQERTCQVADLGIPAAVCAASAFSTIKTGDVIILGNTAMDVPLRRGLDLTCSIDRQECLNLRVR